LARGEEYERKAEKKLNSCGLWGSKFDKVEGAADLFFQAAYCFKLAESCISISPLCYINSIHSVSMEILSTIVEIGEIGRTLGLLRIWLPGNGSGFARSKFAERLGYGGSNLCLGGLI